MCVCEGVVRVGVREWCVWVGVRVCEGVVCVCVCVCVNI